MNSIPLLITAAFCVPAGIVIGFCIARILVNRQLRATAHQAWMDAIRHYQEQAAANRR